MCVCVCVWTVILWLTKTHSTITPLQHHSQQPLVTVASCLSSLVREMEANWEWAGTWVPGTYIQVIRVLIATSVCGGPTWKMLKNSGFFFFFLMVWVQESDPERKRIMNCIFLINRRESQLGTWLGDSVCDGLWLFYVHLRVVQEPHAEASHIVVRCEGLPQWILMKIGTLL